MKPMTSNVESEPKPARGPNHGAVCYLQIPALDLMKSAAFYEKVFGWHIERPYPSFESPGLIGQWITDRAPAPDSGPLIWINVSRIDDTLESVRAGGGDVIEPPSADGPRWLAIIRFIPRATDLLCRLF
jgi:uncharacterized protein